MTDNNGDLSNTPISTDEMPLLSHVAELRTRLIKTFIGVAVIFLALALFARPLYNIISAPLVRQLPHNVNLIATDVASSFLAPIKLALFMAILLSIPWIAWQIWGFIAPALYKHEKRIATPLLLSAIGLFYAGVAFAYYLVLTPALAFFVKFAPSNVTPMTDIQSYLDFVIKLFLVFGVTFEVPVITLLLVLLRVVSVQALVDKRRYIIVGCFAVAAVITPPDGATMIMLAIPMWLLFELGLLLARTWVKDKS